MQEKEYKKQMIIAGRGGQGVMFLAELIINLLIQDAYTAKMHTKMDFSQRGGRVWANIKIGNFNSSYSGLNEIDILILLEGNDVIDHIDYLKEDGIIISNNMSDENINSLKEKYPKIQIINIDASYISWKICKSYSNINIIVLRKLIESEVLPLRFNEVKKSMLKKFTKDSNSMKCFEYGLKRF